MTGLVGTIQARGARHVAADDASIDMTDTVAALSGSSDPA